MHLFFDNTSSTNKKCYLIWHGLTKLFSKESSLFLEFHLIAGHTKFSPLLLFSKISQTYNWSDISTREEPKNVIAIYADVVVDDGTIVCDWRKAMAKYSK